MTAPVGPVAPRAGGETPRPISANAIAVAVSQILGKAFGLVVILLIARRYSVEEYGRFAFAFTWVAFVAPFLDLGTDPFLTRRAAAEPGQAPRLLAASLAIKAALLALALPATIVLGRMLGYPETTRGLILYALAATAATILAGSFVAILRAAGRMDLEAVATVAGRAAILAVSIWVASIGLGVGAMGGAQVVGGALTLLIAALACLRLGVAPRPGRGREAARELVIGGVPFAATAVLVTLYFRIDTLMLAHMQGERAVAFYNANVNLVFAALLISQALVTAVFPVIARNGALDSEPARRVMRRALTLSLAAGIPFAVGGVLVGRGLLLELYGESYAAGARSLALLLATVPILFVTNLVGHALAAVGRQRTVLAVSAANAALNIGLNLWLIPRFGYEGASAATLITEVVGLLAFLVILRLHWAPWTDRRGLGMVLAANLILILLLAALGSLPWWAAAGVAGAAYAALLVRLGVVRLGELLPGSDQPSRA